MGDLSPVEDHDPIREGERLLLVVRDVDHRRSEGLLQPFEFTPHREPRRHVERRHRLVEEDHVGTERQRPRDRDPLLLTAREFSRHRLRVLREPDGGEHFPGAPPCDHTRFLFDLQRVFDVLLHAHILEQRVVLEYDPHSAPIGRGERNIDPILFDGPCLGGEQTDQQPEQGRFPAPRRTEDREKLAVPNGKRNARQDLLLAVALREIADDQFILQ